ncbi:MAG: leucyl aminopeptidase [Nitrospinae bacterium]|nr:leucyl aminopeptidase [Nitrospinota bacterium]
MKFIVSACDLAKVKTEGLVVPMFEGEKIAGDIKTLDGALGGFIARSAKNGVFEGKYGQSLSTDSLGNAPAGKITLAGMGKREELTLERVRQAAGGSARTMRNAGIRNFATGLAMIRPGGVDEQSVAQAVAEGTTLALYSFENFKSEKSKKKIENILAAARSKSDEPRLQKGVDKGVILAEAACMARDLINLPGNVVTPTYLAEKARETANKYRLKCTVFGPKEIEKRKMGGLMAVAKGSRQPARFIILEYMKGPKNQKPVALVGKGLTFDTGGISIKPSERMEEMKADMSGGAAVIGAIRAAAALKLKANIVGLIPSTENMPGGSATKPGDVATSLSGVTMEIINTDAEGRLILSDALAYSKKFDPDCVVDIATLTGACMVALGYYASGLFGNDDQLIEQIREAGEATGERCWPMPLWPEYEEQIKSEVADIKNVGPRWGGAITAAAFLKKHVSGKWAHLDIAGTAYNTEKGRPYLSYGGVGIGVRQMISFIEKRLGL